MHDTDQSRCSQSTICMSDITEKGDYKDLTYVNFKSETVRAELDKLQVIDSAPFKDQVRFCLIQSPIYIITAFYWFFLSFYLLLVKQIKPANEREVLKLLFNTSLAALACQDPHNKNVYVIQVNACLLHLETNSKKVTEFYAWKMMFELKFNRPWYEAQVKYFSVNGMDITFDSPRQYEVLLVYLTGSLHFKMHSVSEPLMQVIEENRLETLYPSLVFTRSLHRVLIKHALSPLSSFARPMNGFPIVKETGIAENSNYSDIGQSGLAGLFHFRESSPFYAFLWELRPFVLEEAQSAGLECPYADYFFLHSVVHSLDHYNLHVACKNVRFVVQISGEERTLFRSWAAKMFCALFVKPMVNPLYSYRMKHFRSNSIYGRIYNRAATIDPEMAEQMTAGTMF